MEPRDLLLAPEVDTEELDGLYRRHGFRSPTEADRNLQEIAGNETDRRNLARSIDPIFTAFGSAVDPDTAMSNLERYVSEIGNRSEFFVRLAEDPSLVELLASALGGSSFLAGILIRNPEYLHGLRADLERGPKSREDFITRARESVRTFDDQRDRLNALHRFQRRELLRIGVRDLSGESHVRDITHELSWLADAIIQVVFDEAWRAMGDRLGENFEFAVIAVGKLGGEELNFSSDIDIIYIYSDDAYAELATKLARRINQALSEPTGEGMFYRVDLRLRPDGGRGPMASSLRALQTYYDSWGETFERLALSKARFSAGHPTLGETFLKLVGPFVYRRYLDYAAIDEVRDIKRRIDSQVGSSGELELNVKLGRGGIREIEFFVQAIQVLYGGEIPGIRVKSTLTSIDRLEDALLIERAVARRLRDAYVFLRNVEHKLQIVDFRQTHSLPKDRDELARCAARMQMSLPAFESTLDAHRNSVHDVFGDLFSRGSAVEEGLAATVHRFVRGGMDDREALEWLEGMGFEPRQALDNLRTLRDAPAFGRSPTRMKNLLANVVTPLLENASKLIRPGRVLNGFERITSEVGAREALYTSLLESPRSIPRLAQLFALSDYLSETLFRKPGAVEFLIDDSLLSRKIPQPIESRSRRIHEFYVGAQHLFGIISRRQASRLMSRFAERELRNRLSVGDSVAVFALGKFGERELNYRSDLDVIAFYEGDYAAACRMVEGLTESLGDEFQLDLRLRPEGRKGSLVWNLERTAAYLGDRGETWERMAWTKARFIAGDRNLADQFAPLIDNFVYGRRFGTAEVDQMKRIRKRMERELAKEKEGRWDLKLGKGGLVDLEFLAEFLQIHKHIRIPNTALVLKRAGISAELIGDYHFLRDVESMLRLWSLHASTQIDEKDLPALELMLSLESFPETYERVTERIREAFEAYRGEV